MLARAFAVFACLLVGTVVIARAERSEPVPIRASFDEFPMQIGEWRGARQPPLEPRVLAVLGVNDYMTRVYYRTAREGADLYIGYYESQRQGDTIHSPLNCMPGAGWTPVSQTTIRVPVEAEAAGPASEIEINRYLIEKGLDTQLVLYWYQSHGRVIASEYVSKFFLVRDAITLNRTDGSLVRVIVPVSTQQPGGEAQAERTAVGFVKAMFPLLGHYLPT
jgi:EpsI family protein